MRHRKTEPRPKAIDDMTGFKVDLAALKKQWDGVLTVDPDRRHPQDFVRGRADRMTLPFARPEAPDRFMAQNILWEDGRPIVLESGAALLGEGEVVVL